MDNLFKKLFKALTDPDYRFLALESRGFYNKMDDEKFLKRKFKAILKYPLNLDDPKTFNEKIQWLKLYDHRPEYTAMVDKFEAKKYVEKIIGGGYTIPTLGVWDDPDDIDFDALPDRFVLKCTHNSGLGMCICKDKSKLDINKVKNELRAGLRQEYYYSGREWPYKNIKPRIIAEEYMEDESGYELKDYKIFCFNGEPHFIQVDFGRFKNHERNLYNTNWEYMGFATLYPTNPEVKIARPQKLEKMVEIAKKLSEGIPHVRVDLYSVYEKIYFGELTFYHGSGYEPFTPVEWDYKLGDYLFLPQQKKA